MSLQTKVKVLIGLVVVAVGCFFWAFYWSGKTEQAVKDNPPFSNREVRAIKKKSSADSAKAVVYKRLAVTYHQQKDSALTIAKKFTAQADSLHAQITSLPAVSGGPISAVERRLATYQSPDTTGF